jgi:hypothetical protein
MTGIKRSGRAAALVTVALYLLAAGSAAAADWSIELRGQGRETVTAGRFAEAKQHSSHYTELRLQEKGKTVSYRGMPLWYLIAMVDDGQESHPYSLDTAAWQEGYDVTLTAADGYSATFNTAEMDRDALYVADRRGGEAIAPRVVGEASKSLWVKNLTLIEVFNEERAERQGPPDFSLKLTVGGETQRFSIAELERMPIYTEGPGAYTTSAGTTYTHTYGGVKLADLLGRYLELKPDTAVTFAAMDGYEMTYTGREILNPESGTWILAFKRDGRYMPRDPGYIRTVRVGPQTPNMLGHKSVKMVEEIKVQAEGFKDFSLRMEGKMEFDLERHTLQSGVSCHSRTVTFAFRGSEAQYTGIPLYLLLAYVDDHRYAPHKQKDKSITSYAAEAAQAGYTVRITAADGFSIDLNSRQLHRNDDVIIAMYKEGEVLPEREWPLIIVWDEDAERVPDGIKPVRNIEKIELLFDQ